MSTAVEEELGNIFSKCDINGTGVIDINVLLDYLVFHLSSQTNPSEQRDGFIREQFSRIFDPSTAEVTKEHFINSLLNHAEAFMNKNEEEYEEEDLCSSTSSGIGESKEITPATSVNSVGDVFSTVNYVSDGQVITNDDSGDEVEVDTAESSFHASLSRSAVHQQNEVISLQRKCDYLEQSIGSLVGQVAAQEEAIIRLEEENKTKTKKLINCNEAVEQSRQKQEEAEEKMNTLIDKHKVVTAQLSRTEKENSKLKEFVSELEVQLECTSNEGMSQSKKCQELLQKLKALRELQSKSQKELVMLKIKGLEDKEVFDNVMDQNKNFLKQLESSDLLIQDFKAQLSTAQKELSALRSAKVSNVMEVRSSPSDTTANNSLMYLDDISYSSVPFESSLLAELKDKECFCACSKTLSFSSMSSISVNTDCYETADAETNTDEKTTSECATMTLIESKLNLDCASMKFLQLHETVPILAVKSKDVGVNCRIKIPDCSTLLQANIDLCNLESKRSRTKWLIICLIVLFLCFLFGFLLCLVTLTYSAMHSPHPFYCLSSIFDLFHSSITYNDILKPIQ